MDSWGDRMPLPDAIKRSPRVYTNLQNIDLDTVTFANVQDTGNPIAIEEMNEDEMRRLVLVNLARLVCAGEWNGLLTAASGGNNFNVNLVSSELVTNNVYQVAMQAPWGSSDTGTDSLTVNSPQYYPFIAPETGNVTSMMINISSAGADDLLVGIYSDDDGLPNELQGYATFDASSTGSASQTSFSSIPALTVGTQYWVGWVRSSANNLTYYVNHQNYGASIGISTSTTAIKQSLQESSSDNALPATVTPANLSPQTEKRISLGVVIG